MRCKYGGTPQCKVLSWVRELEELRRLVLGTGLTEEIKWGVPVYTHKGKNVLTINALKASANIGFFKGVLLSDPEGILLQQGNKQADRLIKFTKLEEIEQLSQVLHAYIEEAIRAEDSGQKVTFSANPVPMPDELLEVFENEPLFEKAFYALTPGRQRGYIHHFSQPKQSQTRRSRIEKHKMQIYKGVGLHDHY